MNNLANYNAECDAGAAVAAMTLGMGNGLFKDLSIGAQFQFKDSAETYTKLNEAGWYVDSTGRRYKTGTRTAIFR